MLYVRVRLLFSSTLATGKPEVRIVGRNSGYQHQLDLPSGQQPWRSGGAGNPMLPDIEDEIAAAVRSAIKRRVSVLFTSGGLGPTDVQSSHYPSHKFFQSVWVKHVVKSSFIVT